MHTYKYVHTIYIYVDELDEAYRYTWHSSKVSYTEEEFPYWEEVVSIYFLYVTEFSEWMS